MPDDDSVFDFDLDDLDKHVRQETTLCIDFDDSDDEEAQPTRLRGPPPEPELARPPPPPRAPPPPPAASARTPGAFTESANFVPTVSACAKPIDVFKLFFTEDTLAYIHAQTNLYRAQKSGTATPPTYPPIALGDLRCFFGMTLWMACFPRHEIRHYWSVEEGVLDTRIAHCISRNDFEELYTTVHFADNSHKPASTDPARDRLFLIRPLLDRLIPPFRQLKVASEYIVLDEADVPYKGRLVMRQYDAKKPHKYHFKAFVVAEAGTGYCLNWNLYTHKSDPAMRHTVVDIVMDNIAPFLDRSRTLFLDNWYTSRDVALALLARATRLCGTIRENRAPSTLGLAKNAARGMCDSKSEGDITFTVWRDKKDVRVISTGIPTEPQHNVSR